MTQENKELLLRDLSARLTYGVKIQVNDKIESIQGINVLDNVVEYDSFLSSEIKEVKPYLFPMSSMTEEHIRKFYRIKGLNLSSEELIQFNSNPLAVVSNITTYNWSIDWLNAHHYDYRGLIEKGLAINAINLNIY